MIHEINLFHAQLKSRQRTANTWSCSSTDDCIWCNPFYAPY